MLIEALRHAQTREFIRPVSRGELCVRLQARRADLRACTVIHWDRYATAPSAGGRSPMRCFARDGRFDHWEAVVTVEEPARYLRYCFELEGEAVIYLGARGASGALPADHPFEFLYANERDVPSVPRWMPGRVFYQIFPDRFSRRGGSTHPSGVESWDAVPTRENFFGGNLGGIADRLDYLSNLGISALYLNPVFCAPSNHRYDTTDYYRIDGLLGGTRDLRDLVEECHRRDIRVVLDGVFNHCGLFFKPFQDVVRRGARSRYRDWFHVRSYPVRTDPPTYECVGNYAPMPKLRTANPEVREYLFDVARHWVRQAGIDGWRLDVADEMEPLFWQEMRRSLKDVHPDILLLGETWRENPDMLRGDQMDSVMNYPFRDAMLDFFARRGISPSELDARLNRLLSLYPWESETILYNLLGSHDTPRFLRMCGDDARRLMLAVGFQMTFPGVPAVYYGDEAGMTGDNDPDCRRPMVWDPERRNDSLTAWFRSLIGLRRARKSLSHGDFLSVICDDERDVYGFVRGFAEERTYVVLNRSDAGCRVELPICDREPGAAYRDLMSGEVFAASAAPATSDRPRHNGDILHFNGELSVPLAPQSIRIIAKGGEETPTK